MNAKTFTLGKKYRDKVTSTVGTATGKIEYLSRSPQVMLTWATKDGGISEYWFEHGQLVEVDE